MALSRKRKIIIAVAAVAIIGIVVVISIFANSKDEPEVVVVKVEARPELRSVVTASGEVRPIQFINLTSEVAGRIEDIFVNPGDQVTKGQPLVRLDPTQLQTQQEAQAAGVQVAISDVQNARSAVLSAENNVAQSRQALTVAEAAVAQARQSVVTAQTAVDRETVNLNAAQRELKRSTELVESGVATRVEYDAARDRFEQAQVSLRTAKAQLEQQRIGIEEAKARVNQQRVAVRDAQIGVQRARQSVSTSEARVNQAQALLRGEASQRSKATQLSPLTGVVADIPARKGQFALANFQSTPLMTIADMSVINIEVNVDETEIDVVNAGQPVKIKVDALGERELEGIVKLKTPLAISKSGAAAGGGLSNNVNVQEAKEFKVVIEILKDKMPDEIRNNLKPGMTATATITTKVQQNVLAVPLQAIVEKRPEQPSGSPGAATPTPTPAGGEKPKDIKGVFVLQGNKVKFVEVTTGITGESDIEILSGLQPGMEVITGPSRVLRTLKEDMTVKKQEKKAGGPDGKEEAKS
ncbi:MAG TPA: efflux RND transporter periplasmic adaptor subunit [Pyrinomonadaceae bacterium]|jgi:HlyD family secretion protein|nr:efflux RND transporter periplasmic adaptor subunit [Pyrinomonadaceae bacterium]